jgi:hypothetical protein
MAIVIAYSHTASGNAPRSAPPTAVSMSPTTIAGLDAKPSDQQRARHSREGEQHRRQSREKTDLGCAQVQFVME